ncbi:hypothetical protein [Sporisorium scitamineum]|uniref:Uncharacterized protein n=1 Tax=Sporisorium scitamineum TaxID=49012 RepID=A0A0F7S582_9BASI|nr:hypothetical protein [Sporisorium scitamineum]
MSVLGLLNSDIGGDFSFDDLFRQPLCLSQQDDASVHGLGQSHSHGPEPSDGHAHSLSPLSANSSTSGSPDHLRAVDDSDDNTNGTKHTTSTSTSSNGGAAGGSGGTGPSSSVQSPVRSSELTITQRQNARRHVFNASFNILRSLTQCPQAFNKHKIRRCSRPHVQQQLL